MSCLWTFEISVQGTRLRLCSVHGGQHVNNHQQAAITPSRESVPGTALGRFR